MMFKQVIHECIELKNRGISKAIPSYCTANMTCIEAILRHYKNKDTPFLIEATSNQVNQFGGYTNMTPVDYMTSVYDIADRVGFKRERLMLAGDHLGPLPWADLNAEEAMRQAHTLVREFVLAGYEKIHLDTSIRLKDDPQDMPDELIAERGVALYQTCMEAWKELKARNSEAHPLSFIIGSEVPPAGGSKNGEPVKVTSGKALRHTLQMYEQKFREAGIDDAWDSIVGVVVQPGVEYGSFSVRQYRREDARELCSVLKAFPHLCFEGHSTDFQFPRHLRMLAEDGVLILKVGPAITYAMREALANMCEIERIFINDNARSHFKEILDSVMQAYPKYWEKYYGGADNEKRIQRKFSFLDRSRYYMADQSVRNALKRLEDNINKLDMNPGIIHQYFRNQYDRLYCNNIECNFSSLIFDYIAMQLEEYDLAAERHSI